MTFFENSRNTIFWLLDLIKGSPVRKHINDVRAVMTSRDSRWVKQQIDSRLNSILAHAVESTEFYRNYDVKKGIEAFPVLDKNAIRNHLPKFLSNRYDESQRIPAITSGSTGTPFETFQSEDKRSRNTADTLYFASLAGYTLGNKLYYLKIWSEYNKKSNLLQKLQNVVPVDVLNLKRNVTRVIDELNTNSSPVSLIGYVSAFETLCKSLDVNNTISPHIKVNSIITMSESLNDYTKISAQKYFGCPVLSRYSNIENGIIAQQTLTSVNDFVINKASYFVEVLDLTEDRPVAEGNLGRIVVTDYFNRVMPLIRYDTGDLGVLEKKMIGGTRQLVFSGIEGRKLDQIYNTKGELISSYIVYKNMWNYTEIEQYQLVQKDLRKYVFKISVEGEFKREKELIREFKSYLGDDADFSVEYVKEIPLLQSGKRKKVVNEMTIANRQVNV